MGGGGGAYIPRYGRCCFEIWEVLCWGVEGVIHFEIWEGLFRDIGGAVLRYGRCGNVFWEAGILDMQDWWPSG